MRRFIFILLVFTLFTSLVHAQLITSGELRTRMALFNYIEKDAATQSYTDSRFQMTFENQLHENLTAVWKVQVGDLIWGRQGFAFPGGDANIKTQNLYLGFLCPVTGFDARIGLQGWSDPRSLVLDDDTAPFTGIMLNKEFGDGINVEVGTAKLEKVNIAKDFDRDLFFLNVEKEFFGANTIVERSNSGDSLRIWFMPFFNYYMDNLALYLLGAYNYGFREDGYFSPAGEREDITNNGFAISVKGKYDMDDILLGLDFLLASGDDGDDPTSTSYFVTIQSFYDNGLEIFGKGIHSGLSIGDVDPGNDGYGLMSMVLSGAYPLDERMTLKGAFGFLSALEADDNDMGIEIDLGMNYMLYENLSFDLVGAMAMPGDFFAGDPDNVLALVSRFMYRF